MIEQSLEKEYFALPEIPLDRHLLYQGSHGESDEQILRKYAHFTNDTKPTRQELAAYILRLAEDHPDFPLFRGGKYNVFKKDWSFSLSEALGFVSHGGVEGPERSMPTLGVMRVKDLVEASKSYHRQAGNASLVESLAQIVEVGPRGWDYPYRNCRINVDSLAKHGNVPRFTQYRRATSFLQMAV